jgi:nigerose phosphorylase
MKNWILEESVYNNSDIFRNGDKFMTGNGYMGYRGTLEEYSKNELGACILAGLYDKVGDKWREPVNAPNGFFIKVYCDGEELSVLTKAPEEHSQKLNIRNGVHSRKSIFNTAEGKRITLSSERFPSMDDIHLMCMKYEIKCDSDCSITVETGIDGDVWDINGPHLEEFQYDGDGQTLVMKAVTHELKIPVAVAELFDSKFGVPVIQNTDKRYIRRINFEAAAGETHSFCKYVSVYTGSDPVADAGDAAAKCCSRAAYAGYENLLDKSSEVWERYWSNSDIIIRRRR